jgi:proteasome accessory factor C
VSTNDRLERILYVLPRAAKEGGAPIDELSRALDVTPADILADIEAATSRVFHHDGGYVDPFNLVVDGDTVRLFNGSFDRPVRLTQAEAMALGLGLRVLAAEADAERREEILALAHQLESELVTPDLELRPLSKMDRVEDAPAVYGTMEVSFEPDDFRGELSEAVEEREWCDVVYLKAGASGPTSRRIAPVRLVYANGHWYVRAYEQGGDRVRSYRLDRVLELRRTSEHHSFADTAHAIEFASSGGTEVTVRYSPSIARWVAEREDTQIESDGSVSLVHDVVDPNWLVRHVLQYGGEAIVETEPAREVVAKAASQII